MSNIKQSVRRTLCSVVPPVALTVAVAAAGTGLAMAACGADSPGPPSVSSARAVYLDGPWVIPAAKSCLTGADGAIIALPHS
jgi:hypothetical protein